MSDKTKEEFEAWHSEQVSRLLEHGEPTAAGVWADFKSLLEITWKASRAMPQPIFDEAKERQLFELDYHHSALTRDGDEYIRMSVQLAWEGWQKCAQSRAKSGEDE